LTSLHCKVGTEVAPDMALMRIYTVHVDVFKQNKCAGCLGDVCVYVYIDLKQNESTIQ